MNNSNTQVEYKISQAGHKEDGSNNTPETLNGTANLAAAGNPATHSTTGAPVKHESEEHASPWLFYGFSMFAFLLIVIFAINATKKMQMIPKKSQNIGEMIIEALYGLPTMVMGERGKKYAPFISTFFLYIVIMNLSGLIPVFKSGTASLSVTLGLGIFAFFMVQYYGFQTHGLAYIKHFAGPVAWLSFLIFPLEILSELIRPISLSMRLYGNIFGEEQVIQALSTSIPVIGPYITILMLPLQLLTCVLQAFVFSLLVTVYISMATEKHDDNHEGQHA